MKQRILMMIYCGLLAIASTGENRAIAGTIQPTAILQPIIISDVVLVGPKKKRRKKDGGRQYNRGVSYSEALAMCRKKYGRGNVVRVTIRKDGYITCHVDAFSPESKGNYNRKR